MSAEEWQGVQDEMELGGEGVGAVGADGRSRCRR